MRLHLLLLGSFFAAAAAGCSIDAQQPQPASLQDNFGDAIAHAIGGNTNGLNTPYVAGSRFTITVQAGGGASSDGWTLSSSNPGVLEIGGSAGQGNGAYEVYAAGSGQATLVVKDRGGKVLDSEDVEVDVPTQIELCEQGLLFTGDTEDQATIQSLQVVSGGTATLLVRYFAGGRELYGNNALTAANTHEALAAVTSTSFSVRDFVQITGIATGASTVGLTAGGATLNVPVQVVDPSAITSILLSLPSESGAREGEGLYVFGRAIDGDGRDVYGSSFAWTAGGTSLMGNFNSSDPTDLLAYQYHSGGMETITASADGRTVAGMVHGQPGTTSTSSSEDVACTVAHGAGAPGSAATGLLIGLVAVAARRRRCSRA